MYPHSEKAIDVHHLFTDLLAQYNVGLMLNSQVKKVSLAKGMLLVTTETLELSARAVLIATGGVSYPKTGSVGDGQKMAAALGHKVQPFRPGLTGFNMPPNWLQRTPLRAAEEITLTIQSNGKTIGITRGTLDIEKYGISGPAVLNASRIIARENLNNYTFEIRQGSKCVEIHPVKPRPLKEAIVTVGGVTLDEVNPQTMESKKVSGLYFAGEVLDIDGPSGGYNLQAAFSTARLAIDSIAKNSPLRKNRPSPPPSHGKNRPPSAKRYYKKRRRS